MKKKAIVKDYFSFARWQRNALIVLLPLLAIAAAGPFLYKHFINTPAAPAVANYAAVADGLAVKEFNKAAHNPKAYKPSNPRYNAQSKYPDYKSKVDTGGESFAFDPNTASAADWARLGVNEKTIATIQKYLSKGGRFRQPADIRRIYGLSQAQKDRLEPLVNIAQYAGNTATAYTRNKEYSPNRAAKTIQKIEINSADTSAWISLYGIGSKLAARIVNFREKLGGFYSIDQVAETYGLPDSTFQKIKPYLTLSQAGIRKRNLNQATAADLKMPYINHQLANVIVNYRTQHGRFEKVEDLKKIMIIDEPLYAKIAPYLAAH